MILSHKSNSRDKSVNMKRVIIKFNRKKSWIQDYSQWKNERMQNNGSNTSLITRKVLSYILYSFPSNRFNFFPYRNPPISAQINKVRTFQEISHP